MANKDLFEYRVSLQTGEGREKAITEGPTQETSRDTVFCVLTWEVNYMSICFLIILEMVSKYFHSPLCFSHNIKAYFFKHETIYITILTHPSSQLNKVNWEKAEVSVFRMITTA